MVQTKGRREAAVSLGQREFDFRVLGSLDVRVRGEIVPVSAGKQRVVLAMLLLYANEPVPPDRLIDELWEVPPRSAAGTLQSLVSRLRASMASVSPQLTNAIRRSDGYLIDLDMGELDLLEFRDRATRARRDVHGGRYAEAIRHVEGALRLWRGRPFSDVPPTKTIEAAARRLLDDQLDLREELLGLYVRTGRFHEVVADARALVAEHSLRERLWAHLMTALDHCGRRGEALAAFRTARETLRAELGIEPGQELQRIHQVILSADERGRRPMP